MKVNAIIQSCIEIERSIADLYASFARDSAGSPVGDLWSELARDEIAHGIALQAVADLPSGEREESSIAPARLEALRQTVRVASTTRVCLDDAFRIALDLEDAELDNIYRRLFAITLNDPRLSHAFRSALGEVDDHEQKLIRMIEAHSENAALLRRAADRRRHVRGGREQGTPSA